MQSGRLTLTETAIPLGRFKAMGLTAPFCDEVPPAGRDVARALPRILGGCGCGLAISSYREGNLSGTTPELSELGDWSQFASAFCAATLAATTIGSAHVSAPFAVYRPGMGDHPWLSAARQATAAGAALSGAPRERD